MSMRLSVSLLAALVAVFSVAHAQTASGSSEKTVAPRYVITFLRGAAISGVSATPAIQLPFNCTSDGAIFITFVGTVPANSGVNPPLVPPTQLVHISPSFQAHTFTLEQVPELYVSRELDHYATDSEVVFLVKGAREKKMEKKSFPMKDGSRHEYEDNAAEQHLYILTFSRTGEYRHKIQIDDSYDLQHIAVFPSGMFLAYGYDENASPKLIMLNDDGKLLRELKIPSGDVPNSAVDAKHRQNVVPTDMVPEGRSVLVVQNNSTFPLLEVSEGGDIRVIRPKLPDHTLLRDVITSDQNLYVVAAPKEQNKGSGSRETLYEVNSADGSLLGEFELGGGRSASDLACVHEGKFLSIDFSDGRLVPLTGTPEPAHTPGQSGNQ